jgi:hypothetical protein
MNNPFEVLETRLSNIESLLLNIQAGATAAPAPAAPKSEDYLHIEDIQQEFKIPIPTIRRHAKRIGFIKFGRRLMFRRGDILRWLEANEHKGRVQVQSEAIERLKAVR